MTALLELVLAVTELAGSELADIAAGESVGTLLGLVTGVGDCNGGSAEGSGELEEVDHVGGSRCLWKGVSKECRCLTERGEKQLEKGTMTSLYPSSQQACEVL